VNYSRLLGSMILAFTSILLISVPASPAFKPPKKAHHAAKPKKKAPKPKHQAKHKVKAKSHHHGSAHKKASHAHKNKKKSPKPKHHAKQHVKAKSHKAPHNPKPKRDRKQVHAARTHAHFHHRAHEWSKHSRHEHHWHHHHWHTHHFAHFHGGGGGGGGGDGGGGGGGGDGGGGDGAFQFDPGWWNNYVVNPGVVAWSDNAPTLVAPALPGKAVSPPVVKIDQSLPLSKEGEELAKTLDSMQVETNWLADQEVDWETGKPSDPPRNGPASNGGAFVAAVCNRFALSLPHSGFEDFLPGNQMDWFLNVGKERGWIKVGEVESQVLANQGWIVVAAWQNMASAGHRENSGQLGIVRPDRESVSALAERGPLVIMAGLQNQNHNSIGVKDGFPPGAWSKQEVVYLAHRAGKDLNGAK
jgi:hypothetical protein